MADNFMILGFWFCFFKTGKVRLNDVHRAMKVVICRAGPFGGFLSSDK